MKKQLIWVFKCRKSVHYWWSYILFSQECKELTSMLDPLLYRWGVPPVVIRCVHWTMQMWVLQTWIIAQGPVIVMQCNYLPFPWFRCYIFCIDPSLYVPISQGLQLGSCWWNKDFEFEKFEFELSVLSCQVDGTCLSVLAANCPRLEAFSAMSCNFTNDTIVELARVSMKVMNNA